jgi:4'-phosphopantetheinyl transferase
MSRAAETPDKPVIAQWILDTRSWYPEVTQTKQLETHVSYIPFP